MAYPGINIQGNIISGEILDKIRGEDIKYQQAGDFGLDRKISVRDEIGLAWTAARAHWTAFTLRRGRIKEGDSGTAETRNSWMIPLLNVFGYEVEKAPAYIHPGTQKSYAISHRAANLGGFPIHIMGINDDMDRRRETSGPKLSPHALTQEYLNNTDHVYALVTNGKYLRLLRDATRLVRLSFLEFDLEKIMEEELYTDFAILFRVLHATRMPKSTDDAENSFIEYYHQESLASGSRIREKLSQAVEKSIRELANGFLSHPDNHELRNRSGNGLTPADYYLYQLRLIYRLLFLIVTEERNLVYPTTPSLPPPKGGGVTAPSRPPPKGGGNLSHLRKIYYEHYSIDRLRILAGKLYFVDGRKHDLWEGLKTTFRLFEDGVYGEKLGIKPLGSGIFSRDALGMLNECKLSNEALLRVIRNLTFFENDNRQLVRVNYSDLDVEEFGSVYEGLLEYKPLFQDVNGKPSFVFAKGDERSKSGSHYTPEELVKPLIKHSLDYIFEEKLKEQDKEKALLSIRVCDIASGSGHILLSAARRIAIELARVRTKEDQPTPTAFRTAIRDVIRNCIYGVDKNPLAVELCKVALWLESHNPGEPLGFLDHHIKCGDSIVGLAHIEELKNGIPNEAFKSLPGDDKEIASAFLKRNKIERETEGQITLDFDGAVRTKMTDLIDAFNRFDQLPENNSEEILHKEKEYKRLVNSRNWQKLKEIANLIIAQFFISKNTENKDALVTDANYREYLIGTKGIPGQALAKALIVSENMKFFHWFLEFPEIFVAKGFDCIIGNPPYLGGSKISGFFGDDYYSFIKTNNPSTFGICDLVAFFLLRNFQITSDKGFIALITTNSISQGDTRESGIETIRNKGCLINFAIKSKPWPGVANLNVSIFSISKSEKRELMCFLDNKPVIHITSFLDSSDNSLKPLILLTNADLCFDGTKIYGDGFIVKKKEKDYLIEVDSKNSEILFEYLGGEDLNESPTCSASRFVINFFNWPIEKAQQYKLPFEIVKAKVKPYRDSVKRDKTKRLWWQYEEKRVRLYERIAELKEFFVATKTSKYLSFVRQDIGKVYSSALVVITNPKFSFFSLIQGTLHLIWVEKHSSTLETRLRYTSTDSFETFPFPQRMTLNIDQKLEAIGISYHLYREQLMYKSQLGLTKTYNLFHSKELNLIAPEEERLDDKPFEKKFGKDALYLRKHLDKTLGTISFKEAVGGIIKLRQLHVEMDQEVLEAYGWSDIHLRHDFYEVDYLPENDRVRYTIHPDARREVLKRLLELNHKIHEEEVAAGLWDKKGGSKKSKKSISETGTVEEPEGGYGGLFD
jgi:hypothetical protein